MAQLLILPIFTPANVAHITQLEWNAWRDDIDDYAVQQGNILGPLDPARALLVGNVPVEYTTNPAATMPYQGSTPQQVYRKDGRSPSLPPQLQELFLAKPTQRRTKGNLHPPTNRRRGPQLENHHARRTREPRKTRMGRPLDHLQGELQYKVRRPPRGSKSNRQTHVGNLTTIHHHPKVHRRSSRPLQQGRVEH